MIRMITLALCLCFGLSILAPENPRGAAACHAQTPTLQQQIDQAIQDLDDDSIETRSNAQAALEQIGEPAIPALRKAAKDDDHPERKARGQEALSRIAVAKSVEDFDLNGNPIKKSEFNGKGELIRETEFGPDGKPVKVTEYRNGKPVKTTEFKNGKPVKITDFRDGKPIKSTEFDKDGKPTKVTDLDPTNDRIPRGFPGLGAVQSSSPYGVHARLIQPILDRRVSGSTVLEIGTEPEESSMMVLVEVRSGPVCCGNLGKTAVVRTIKGKATLPVCADRTGDGKFDLKLTMLGTGVGEAMIWPYIPCLQKCGDKPEVCFSGGAAGGTKLTPCTFSLNPCDGICVLFRGHKGKHYCSHGHLCTK